MEAYLTYAFKSALLLSIFWGIYTLFLKRETFFNINRWFLILGMLTAILLPLVEFHHIVYLQIPDTPATAVQGSTLDAIVAEQTDWWLFLFYIYIIGSAGFAIQFIIELLSVHRIIRSGKLIKQIDRVSYIEVKQETSPFSFFNTIVYNPEVLDRNEMDTILMHEHVHISQKHSLDMILASITKIVLWFNPISWMYKKGLAQNLEYIADFESCAQPGTSEKDYQYLLLNQLSGISNSIINPFFNSLIKKRILMLQKQRSQKRSSWKYALVLPFLAGFMLLFGFKTQVNYLPSNTTTIEAPTSVEANDPRGKVLQDTLPPLYIVNGKQQAPDFQISSIQTDNIKSINILKDQSGEKIYGEKGKNGVIIIELKNKATFRAVQTKEPNTFSVVGSKENPLIYIDGKEMPTDFDYNTIDPNEIDSVKVFKGKKAVENYGVKAIGGVLIITTKTQEK
ncbi:TonB-dependent receptor plug domain-containing protein [Galbibacter sp.]|uniref:TonB-dependent receptor plug domain-containing protein n=1 Tax=Galbibacter sp. TaxID=2918471 RepID=UPI003A8ED1FC